MAIIRQLTVRQMFAMLDNDMTGRSAGVYLGVGGVGVGRAAAIRSCM